MKLGKITIDKKFTTLEQVPKVRQDIQEFKEYATVEDLYGQFKWAIRDTEDDFHTYDSKIVYCNLEAFPGGSDFDDKTCYKVEMLIEEWHEFWKIQFYITQDWEINTSTLYPRGLKPMKMYSVEHYTLNE